MSKLRLDQARALNETARQRKLELGQALATLGGSNSALVPNYASNNPAPTVSLPVLQKALVDAYENTNANKQQQAVNIYNDLKNSQTARKMASVGINSKEDLPANITTPTIMGMSNGAYGMPTTEMAKAGITREDLQRYLDEQTQKGRVEKAEKLAKSHPVVATGASIVSNPIESGINIMQKGIDTLSGKPMQSNQRITETMRGGVSQGIDNKVGRFAYNVGTSGADMLLAALMTGGFGTAPAAIMGLEKADTTINDAIDRGLSRNQALAEGVGSGASTALTEAIPMGILGKGGNVAYAALSEGLQEGAEDIVDTLIDEAVTKTGRNQDRSQLHQTYNAYKRAGYADNAALIATLQDYGRQVGMDMLAGAATGGVLGAGSNAIQGRNIFTGNERRNNSEETNTETETNTQNEIPRLSQIEQERNAQANSDMEMLRQALANQSVNNESIDNVNRNVDSVNETVNEVARPDIENVVRETQQDIDSLLRDIQTGNIDNPRGAVESLINDMRQTARNLPELSGRFNEMLSKFADDVKQIPKLETAQPDTSSITSERESRDLLNLAQQYKDKLSVFEKSDYSKEAKSQIKAIDNAIKSGDMNAIREALANADSVMNGAEVGINARDFNKDSFKQMQEATDGYKIKVHQKDLNNLGIKNVSTLDTSINTGSNNRMHFVAPTNENGFFIDEVYDEIQGKSGGMLPTSENMNTTEMLQALINYVSNPKAGRDDVVNSRSWEDISLSDSRPQAIIDAEQISDKFIDDIIENGSSEEIWTNYLDSMSELATNYPELSEQITDTLLETRQAVNELPESTTKLDDDIKNVQTVEEAVDLLDKEIGAMGMTTDFFGNEIDSTPESTESTRVNTGRQKTSKAYTNTGLNSNIMTEEEQAMHNSDESMLYIENSEKESMDAANKRLRENGKANEYKRLLEDGDYSNVDMDEAMILWKELNDRIRDLKEQGLDYKSELKRAHALFTQIKNQASAGGSRVQALAKWSRNNTPEGLLAEASAIINRAKVGKDGRVDWNKLVAKETKGKTKDMDIDFMDKFMTEASKLEGLDMESREAKHIMANLGKLVNTQIPISLREKITTILMDNMLGNVRTLLTRNAGGNIGFNLLEDFVRRPLSGLIDKAVGKKTGNRTTIGLTRSMLKAGFEGFKDGVGQEIYDFANDIQSARSGENTLGNATGNNRSALTSKIGHFYNKLVKAGLSFGDRPFFEKTYKMTMAEYQQMYDQGMFGDMKKSDFEELAKAYSQLNALTAVYQDNSLISDAFLKMKEAVNDLSQGIVGADVLSQFTMPFVKTPANIIQRSIEYSPVGILKNAVQTIREIRSTEEDFNQSRFVTEASRNIIGTALFAAGMALANSGAMTGAYDEDKDMRQAQKEAGMQEYALHNPFGLEADVDVSWIPVLGNNLVASAAAYDAANNPELSAAQQFGKGATAGLKSQFESSMLQGLQRLIGGSGSFGNDGGDLLSNSVDTLKSGATQFIPSLLRQTAAAFDPYQRQLAGPNPDNYYINSVLSAIPGLRDNLQPKISRTGEDLEQNHARTQLGQILNNYINPANVTYGTPDAVRDEAMRLYESTGNNIAFQPSVTMSELKKDDHVPTAEEFTEYQRNAYGSMNSIASDLIDSEYYQSLNDGEKEQLLADIYSAVKTVEKKKVLGEDLDDLSGAAKAFYEDGDDGLVKYMTAKNILSEMGMQNNPTNREKVYDRIDQGGTEAAQDMVQQAQELEDAGLSKSMQFSYEHAHKYIPSLTPSEFAETYNAINADGNTSIKQSEVIDYLNQHPDRYDDTTAMQYWNAFDQKAGHDGQWKKIPVLNPDTGLWEAKQGTTRSTSGQSSQTSTKDSYGIGQYGKGNIDLYARPQYRYPDGTVATVESMSFNEDGKEVLIPTIAFDKNGRAVRLTDKQAIQRYYDTGEYLGKFNSVKEADKYAEKLHLQQEELYAK